MQEKKDFQSENGLDLFSDEYLKAFGNVLSDHAAQFLLLVSFRSRIQVVTPFREDNVSCGFLL